MAILALTRKIQERVFVGEGPNQVIVTVLEVKRGKVRLAFEAPESVPIDREEIRMAKVLDKENGHEGD